MYSFSKPGKEGPSSPINGANRKLGGQLPSCTEDLGSLLLCWPMVWLSKTTHGEYRGQKCC